MSEVIGYVKIGSIKGNGTDKGHKEWIEVLGISQACNRNINPTSKPADALSKSQVHMGAIDIQKNADESSPNLILAVAEGQIFDKVTIDLVRQDKGGHEVFYQWTLDDAYISNYSMSGTGTGGIETMENISICFSKINWSYKAKKADGAAAPPVDTGFDLNTNTAV